MPTTGGPRGPVPKRSDQRRRRNKTTESGAATKADVVELTTPTTPAPAADTAWHPSVVDLYESLAKSGQAQFFEPSDWAFARLTCELLSRGLSTQKMPAMLIAGCMSDLARLGVTEGDRRRMRIELQRNSGDDGAEKAKVLKLAQYRRAGGQKS